MKMYHFCPSAAGVSGAFPQAYGGKPKKRKNKKII
jgi:hypothetical protein